MQSERREFEVSVGDSCLFRDDGSFCILEIHTCVREHGVCVCDREREREREREYCMRGEYMPIFCFFVSVL